jgi:hypothetical protein
MDGFFHNHAWTANMEVQDPGVKAAAIQGSETGLHATEHSIYLLYPFRWDAQPNDKKPKKPIRKKHTGAEAERLFRPSVHLSTLSAAAWHPGLSEALRKKAERIRSELPRSATGAADSDQSTPAASGGHLDHHNIWTKSRWAIAADMEPHLARLLSQGGFGDGPDGANVIAVWGVNRQNNVRDALNGCIGLARYLKPRPAIAFSAAAVKRLEAASAAQAPAMAVLRVEIDDPGETKLRKGDQLDKAALDKANATSRDEGRKEAVAHPVRLGIPIEFGEVRALGFRTGHGILVFEIHIRSGAPSGAVAMPLLVESLVALCADRHMTWLSGDGTELKEDRPKQKTLSLNDMVGTLLGHQAKHATTGNRVFTYTFAKLDRPINPKQRQRLIVHLVQLACKYTDDYRIDPAAFEERVYQPFDSISHLAALEGAASLVENAPFEDRARARFLEDYGANSIEARYLPVAVVAYHAFLTLVTLLQDSRRWIDLRAPSRKEAEYLRGLRDRALEFRLFHRLSFVSLLTMPNEFYHRLSGAFGLERMLASADRDVAELSTILDTRVREAEADQLSWFHRLTAAALVFISAATLGTILNETVPVSWVKYFVDLTSKTAPWISVARGLGVNRLEALHFLELMFAVVCGWKAWLWSKVHEASEIGIAGDVDDHTKEEIAAHTGLEWHRP